MEFLVQPAASKGDPRCVVTGAWDRDGTSSVKRQTLTIAEVGDSVRKSEKNLQLIEEVGSRVDERLATSTEGGTRHEPGQGFFFLEKTMDD